MKNLYPIEENQINVYKEIAESSYGQKKVNLLGELENIENRYLLYSLKKQNLSEIELIDYSEREELKNQLISCYSENKTLNNLKANIILKQELHYQAKCPYCGISSKESFDHYLPKEDFPEFSVLSINLIPCCGKCNSKKGKRWVDENRNRLFINYYYDVIPDAKYLNAKISFNRFTPTVSYEVVSNDNIHSELFNIIKSHYEKLNLCERFESHANDEASNFFLETRLAAEEKVDIEQQKQSLNRKIRTLRSSAGNNNWLVSLYEAIYQSDEFFEKCYTKTLT